MGTRRNISLPEDLDEAARAAGLNVSALAQQAIVGALDRRARMARLDAWLDELDAEHGPPSAEAVARAEAWLASAVPAAGGLRMIRLGGEAHKEIAGRARSSAAGLEVPIAVATVPRVRVAKSGAAKTSRAAARSTKTTTKSTLSQKASRTRGTKS